MATRLEAVRALLGQAARAVDEGAADADAAVQHGEGLRVARRSSRSASTPWSCTAATASMLDFGIEKLFRDASIFLHMDATADISRLKIVKSLFPTTAGKYAGAEA